MWRVPEGYGSISSWYQWSSAPSPGTGFGVEKDFSSSQTRCHFASTAAASYRSIAVLPSPGTKKPLEREAMGSYRRRAAAQAQPRPAAQVPDPAARLSGRAGLLARRDEDRVLEQPYGPVGHLRHALGRDEDAPAVDQRRGRRQALVVA